VQHTRADDCRQAKALWRGPTPRPRIYQWEGDPIELTIAWVIVMAGVIGLAALLAPGSPDEADPSRSEKERAQIHW